MTWSIVLVEALIFVALFTALVMIPSILHPEVGVHNYPPEIQEAYFKTHKRVDTAPLSARTVCIKAFGILLFTVLLTAGAIWAGATTFLDGFVFAAVLFLIVGHGIRFSSTGCCLPICAASGCRGRSIWTRPMPRSGSM